jgi:hypothetical protein
MPWWGRFDREGDLDRGLRAHLDLEAEELRESGVPRHEALCAAQWALDNATVIKEEARSTWGWTTVDVLLQD